MTVAISEKKVQLENLDRNPIQGRIDQMYHRVLRTKEEGLYLYLQAAERVEGAHITINGRRMLQFASYAYLDLLNHPYIQSASAEALERFGTGTHGVRVLAGTTSCHVTLEQKIAEFKHSEAAIALSSGYVTNLGTIAALLGRHDVVISDKANHASIVDGCLLSQARFVRFDHNDMTALEKALASAPTHAGKLVVVDAVFSMDGDVINLPEVVWLCRKYGALLMVDEAHSLGVLGETGHGIIEHFGLTEDSIDIKMGTLSKTIPAVGGYIAGNERLITYLRHQLRAFVFSAALPPASAAAAQASLEVIEREPERVKRLQRNVAYFIDGMQQRGFNTLNSTTPIVPIIVGDDDRAMAMARLSQEKDVFVMPVLHPAVQAGTSRLRANVTAAHTLEEIDYAMDVFLAAGRQIGVVR